jgi:hypothetical protein
VELLGTPIHVKRLAVSSNPDKRQKSWKARWCQLIKVSGFTTTRALRQGNPRDQNSSANLAESESR